MSEIKGKEEEIQHALAVYEAEIEFLEEFDSDEIINLLTYRDFLQDAIIEYPYLMKPYIKKLHLLDKKLMKSAEYIQKVLSPIRRFVVGDLILGWTISFQKPLVVFGVRTNN